MKLRQILINLISNAIKYTNRGGVTLRIEEVTVTAGEDLSRAGSSQKSKMLGYRKVYFKVRVIDTGIGIRLQDMKYLFQQFGTIQNTEDIILNQNGIGLGLNLSNQLCRELSPDPKRYKVPDFIQVESEFGKGSEFYFYLDDKIHNDLHRWAISQPSLKDLKKYRESCEKFLNPSNSKSSSKMSKTIKMIQSKTDLLSEIKKLPKSLHKKVLVIDDNDFNLKILKQLFLRFSLEVDVFISSTEALVNLKTRLNYPCQYCQSYDLIITDFQMPFMNGLQFAQHVREIYGEHFNIECPIVCASADELEPSESHIFQAVLQKPIGDQEIKNLIKTYLPNSMKKQLKLKCTCATEEQFGVTDEESQTE